jgi:hypothetical protein
MDSMTEDFDQTEPVRRSNVRLQFYLSGHIAKKIEDVGAIFGHPTGKAAAFLLDGASGCERRAGAMLVERLRERGNNPVGDAKPAGMLLGPAPEGIVLLQVPLAAHVADRIGRIASRQDITRTKACALLLDRAVDDPGWIVDILRSRLFEVLSKPPSTENKPRQAASASKPR